MMEHLKGLRLFDTIKDKNLRFQCFYEKCPNSCCKSIHTAEIGFNEMFSLSRYFVIHFPYDSENKTFIGNAIMGFAEENTGCVYLEDGKGCKLGKDRPLFCKAYPFFIHPDTSRLIIDPACPGFSEDEGSIIYKEEGISQDIERNYLIYGAHLAEDILRMREFTKFLYENDLLVTGDIELKGKSLRVNFVDEKKLISLKREKLEEAMEKNYLKAIYAHINSFKNTERLSEKLEGGDDIVIV